MSQQGKKTWSTIWTSLARLSRSSARAKDWGVLHTDIFMLCKFSYVQSLRKQQPQTQNTLFGMTSFRQSCFRLHLLFGLLKKNSFGERCAVNYRSYLRWQWDSWLAVKKRAETRQLRQQSKSTCHHQRASKLQLSMKNLCGCSTFSPHCYMSSFTLNHFKLLYQHLVLWRSCRNMGHTSL